MFRLAILQDPLSGNRLDQFGAEDLLGPFDDLLDAAQRTQMSVIAEGTGRIEKKGAGATCSQNPQREFIGAVNDLEKLVVENIVLRLGVSAKDDAERRAVRDDGAIRKVAANVIRVYRIGYVLRHRNMHGSIIFCRRKRGCPPA